jgi:NAD(P)-dependent dehydrogenase (short-subunit alcohol dehydrogenase family)
MTDAVRLDYSNPSVVADPFAVYEAMHSSLPVPMIEPIDVSNGIRNLVSPAGRYVTCTAMRVDAGAVSD